MKKIDENLMVKRILGSDRLKEFVKIMKPLDLVRSLVDFGLSPKGASKVAIDLIKRTEGIGPIGYEPNKQFPIPPMLKKGNVDDVGDEIEEVSRPFGKVDITPKYDFPRHHFPPDPIDEPDDWPYDAATVTSSQTVNKQRKRSLTSAKEPDLDKKLKYVFKNNPLEPDMRLNQPGGDGAGGKGIYSKSTHTTGNNLSMRGNAWSTKGYPGFSTSPPGESFDDPNDPEVNGKTTGKTEHVDDDDLEDVFGNPPSGAAIPTFAGGRHPARRFVRRK